jgi:uncharacterized membrane protein
MHSTPRPAAKYPLTLLAGPYGHPFHPIAVIIPIGAWTSSVVFDLIAVFSGTPEPFVVGARILVLIGLIGAALAVILGFLDWVTIPRGTKARATGTTHMILNLVAIGIFLASYLLRGSDEVAALPIILSIGGLLILSGSGYLGGNLAHKYGVRVADERTQAEGLEPLP